MNGAQKRLLVVALVTAMTVPAAANHLQTDSGKSIAFDHKTGNEFWVEVVLGGADAGSVQRVEAQQEFDRLWHVLEKKSWGAWGGSFQIPPGEEVRFRANWADGAKAVSCWFAHPSGTELCDNPPPPAGWSARKVLTTGPMPTDLGITTAEANGNGRDEVYTPVRSGLFVHERDASGLWASREILPINGSAERSHVVAGDIDGDGKMEIFSSGWNGNGRDLIYIHEFNGMGWESNLVAQLVYNVRSMVIGDIDEDGDAELYIGTSNGFSGRAIYRVDRPPGGFLSFQLISQGAAGLLAIGDADRDGSTELWSAGYNGNQFGVWSIDRSGTGWTLKEEVLYPVGEVIHDLVAGDGDNDGLQELYVLLEGPQLDMRIDRFSAHEAGWTQLAIPLGPRFAHDLVRGDPDNDGRNELYTGDEDGRLLQVRWSGTAWTVTAVAQVGSGDPLTAVAVGDADGDGRKELFAAGAARSELCCEPLSLYRITFNPAPPPPAFDATFTAVRGNEWWAQANVAATGGTLSRVDVSLNGGAWKPLAKQSWGGWAASYHIVQGTVVRFMAISTMGATDLSDCYQWIPPSGQDAFKVTCGSPPPPPGFDATFTNVQGNEWWVQVNVGANQPLSGVDARVNCGTWVALGFQSWGAWAKSFHVPNGAKVDFRARSQTGATDVSGGYVWPQATPTSGC
jgi:VCBS repeat protein